MIYTDYTEWAIPDREWEDNWKYRKFKEYPSPEASDSEIRDFIADAKMAEKLIAKDLVEDDGMTVDEAWKECCQYPLREDAPMSAVRDFIKYMWSLQEATKNGIIL